MIIDGELAGGQLVALLLARAARDAGHQARFVTPTRGPFTELAEAEGFAVDIADVSRMGRFGGLLALRRLLWRHRIELVHTHAMAASNVLSRLAARSAGAVVVGHAHSPEVYRRGPAGTLYRLIDNCTVRLCARVIAVSEATRAALVAQGVPPRLIEVVPNGVHVPAIPPASTISDLGLDDGTAVLCVGRLEPAKGQLDLVEAAALVPGTTFVLVGRDVAGHSAEIERRCAELGVTARVVLAGERQDVPGLMAGAALVAVPSWNEGFPLVPLEAMAAGRPVIATAVGGLPEIVEDGVTGLLVPPHDPPRLAAAIESLLRDKPCAATLGAAGRARARERFSAQAVADRVFGIYAEAIA